ncbi:Toll/interleukin-1 receptor domain-containing adapter protein [Merluccius polli]|uniref:Toll/interleukin-1 receptor domain-containing adapter protein n=1 Tax=Merluccius polli TaxID=89951 RepID=A0AA47N0Z1_MERPO|nr:Toll/interleukin-1 receptor domain-containing adapter protein [Merluccius polli]
MTERINALTGPVKDSVTPAPWKHHSTMPPLLKMVKKSSILSPLHLPVGALTSAARWSRKYDVFVFNSSAETDVEEATRLVAFLEVAPRRFRCFLWHRDFSPGAAIPTELCRAMQDSHCTALLITPHFLQDGWCKYMMQQALASGPMSSSTIPLIRNLPRDQYPQVLQCFYYVDLSTNPDHGYKRVLLSVAIIKYNKKVKLLPNGIE